MISFQKLLQGKITGKIFNNFLDIGSESSLKVGNSALSKQFKKPAFLDRDGVINYDYGYVSDLKRFKFRPGVLKGLKFIQKKKFLFFSY